MDCLSPSPLWQLKRNIRVVRSCCRWNDKRTAMLTRGVENRHSSLDVSIQLSLESKRINPSAIAILQMLSLLPDGILDEDIAKMSPVDVDPDKGSSTLLQTALAFRDSTGRL